MAPERPDLAGFGIGTTYIHDWSNELVEFVGRAALGDDDEEVGVFRFVDDPGRYLLATRATYERGDSFTPADD